MTHYRVYPFTAIIGQERMKLALILNAINPKIGGVLIKGTKGTAKSTAVRALADLLPELRIVKDCPFNCNPDNEKELCHDCLKKMHAGQIHEDDITTRQMEVINLPINATEDRVVGTIDIKMALAGGQKILEPGILAEANRNILYIDEVNLLADNVADVLLDSAAMGINIIEREGISVHHPAKFILIGTMNPEEGNIRPQLLDRFGLSVEVDRITDVDQRVKIITYSEQYHRDPEGFYHEFKEEQLALRQKIVTAREILDKVEISRDLLKRIAEICIAYGSDGHRADIAINLTAKTIAAFNNRLEVNQEDLKLAALLALPHRLRRLPFEDEQFDEELLEELLDGENDVNNQQEADPEGVQDSLDQENSPLDQSPAEPQSRVTNTREQVFGIDASVKAAPLKREMRSREKENSMGKVISHPTDSPRGKYTSSTRKRDLNVPASSDIAILPTINDAAMEPENRVNGSSETPMIIKDNNIHIKSRVGKSSYLVIFCVDASGSMGVQERMAAAKGAVYSILQNNYVNRDKVALVAFRGEKAEVVLPPTRSVDLAYKYLQDIPTGGTTPLVAGLIKALDLVEEEKRKNTGYVPLLVLLSDARGNVYFKDAVDDMLGVGKQIAKKEVEMIIIDVESPDVQLGFAKKLADEANAVYYHVNSLTKDSIKDVLTMENLITGKQG